MVKKSPLKRINLGVNLRMEVITVSKNNAIMAVIEPKSVKSLKVEYALQKRYFANQPEISVRINRI